jgi:hypothetical protein
MGGGPVCYLVSDGAARPKAEGTMPYLDKNQLLAMLSERRQLELINEHLITGVPYVFRDSEATYRSFREILAAQFRTPVADVTIIGSARIGFSLDPEKYGFPFSPSSDIDTVVVNEGMFDVAWHQLVRIGQRRFGFEPRVQTAFNNHRNNNVFFGYIQPNRLPGVVTLANHWFRTFQGLGRIQTLSGYDVNGRLYRTWEHVRAHQLYSLESIALKLKITG